MWPVTQCPWLCAFRVVELCEFCVVRRAGDKIKQYSCCWSGSPLLSSLSSHSAYSDDINACVSTLFLSVVQQLVLSPHAMKGPDLKHSWGPALWNLHMPTWVCFRYMRVFRLHSPKTCMLGSLVILNRLWMTGIKSVYNKALYECMVKCGL